MYRIFVTLVSVFFVSQLTSDAYGVSKTMLTMFCESASTRAACLVTEPDGMKSLGESIDNGGKSFDEIEDSSQKWNKRKTSDGDSDDIIDEDIIDEDAIGDDTSPTVASEFHLLNLFLKKQGSYNLTVSAKELTSFVAAFNLIKWTDKDGKVRWLSKTGATGGGVKAVFNMKHNPGGSVTFSVVRVASQTSLISDLEALRNLGWLSDEAVCAEMIEKARSLGGTKESQKQNLVDILSLIRENYGESVNHRAVTVLTEDIDYLLKRL